MEEVRKLVKKGKIKQALERLLTLVKAEHKQEVTLLLANYNAHQIDVMEGTQKQDATLIARTNKAIIGICDEYEPSSKPKTFAEPPILDNLPLDKDGYLLGRKAALEQLHTSLQNKNILTLVNGMGGIGKSTLAAFYANFPKYKAAYQHCYWVSVSDLTGEIKEALINAFAEALALYNKPQKEQLAKIQTYLSGLQGQTLLILDNANDKKKVTEALDFLRKCKIKVLFTSRANMSNIPAQALEKLLPEDAFTLFTHYFPAGAVMPETPQLLKNIDYHTLLTEFMAKSLAHNPVLSLQDLVEITQQQNFTDELLAYSQITSYHTHTHDNPDAEIQPAEYLLKIFPIQNLGEQEQQILRYFSILPTEWIGIEMLLQLFAADKEKTTRLQLGQVLQSLHEKGWLQKSPTNAFACHILLQHLLRQQLEPKAENCELLLKNLYAAIYFDEYTDRLTLAPYLPLVATVLTWIRENTKLIASIYINSASIYITLGNYSQTLIYNLENLRILEIISLIENEELGVPYINISQTYRLLGDYQKSIEYGLKAINIAKKTFSIEHPNIATSYDNIALTYQCLGNYQQALEYELKAINIYEKELNHEHPNLILCYNNVSVIYQGVGDYQQALEYGLKSISVQEKILNPEHFELAKSYNNLALTYQYLGNYQQALEYELKAINIQEKILSAAHPNLANYYNNIAMIYQCLGDYQRALKYGLKSVNIHEKILSTEHPNLALLYNNITITYIYLEDYRNALEYGLKSIDIYEKTFEIEHSNLALPYNNIAMAYNNLGDYQQSLEYELKAINIYEQALDFEHPNLALFYCNITGIYENLGDYQQSLEYGLKALMIREKVLGVEHPHLAQSYNNISWTYYYLSDYQTAYFYIQKAVTILTKVLPKEHPDIQAALHTKTVIEKAMRGE